MKWEFIAERKNDFLKNCLVYEAFEDNFVCVFGRPHPGYLTVRHGMSYSHYIDNKSASELSRFLLEKTKSNPKFLEEIHETGKRHFNNLLGFCSSLKNPENKTKEELLEAIKEYFRLYKMPYPYFLITVAPDAFEKEKNTGAINTMAKLRFEGRASYNKTHEIVLPLFKEIAGRLNLSVEELKFLQPSEIIALLEGKNLDTKSLINSRQHCFFVHSHGKSVLHENASLEIKEGKPDEIRGRGTFPAKYRGKAKLIHNKDDIKNIGYGDIIVLQMTTTDLITKGIEKAGAIITDEGGITCHAALLSMEMNIPALIGTRIATKRLKDGDIVEIDTEKGIAKKV